MAFADPQKVMNLVQVKLTNNDAYSSIRGVFGGVGVTIIVMLLLISKQRLQNGLWMLAILWGMYSLSRMITIVAEGPLGSFGAQWLRIETAFTILSIGLALLERSKTRTVVQRNASFPQQTASAA